MWTGIPRATGTHPWGSTPPKNVENHSRGVSSGHLMQNRALALCRPFHSISLHSTVRYAQNDILGLNSTYFCTFLIKVSNVSPFRPIRSCLGRGGYDKCTILVYKSYNSQPNNGSVWEFSYIVVKLKWIRKRHTP